MRLKIYHKTFYEYNSLVKENENELRLTPKNNVDQYVESSVIYTYPAIQLKHYDDLNFNRVHRFQINNPHKNLSIESRSIVQTRRKVDYNSLPYGFKHKKLIKIKGSEEVYPFLQNSTFIDNNQNIWKQAVDIKNDSDDVLQTAYHIMDFIFNNFKYSSGITNVSTHANEIIKRKEGVCQDFAHAMVAYCRTLSIPARYVSGYFYDSLRNNSLRGSQASHAWVEVFIEGFGWIGLDPTNRKIVDDTYVVLAVGRDYFDVSPVSGVYYGLPQCDLNIKVKVELT